MVGYLLRTFPVLTETFVSAEIRQLSGLIGAPLPVAALYRPCTSARGELDPKSHQPPRYWRDIDKSKTLEIALAQGRWLLGRPREAARVLTGAFPEPLPLRDRLRAGWLASFFARHNALHLHSHFGWEQVAVLRHLKRLAGFSYSLTLHAADIFVNPQLLAERIADSAFTATVSRFNKNWLVERLGAPADKIHVLHCGVDVDRLRPLPRAENRQPRIVSVGRMVGKKGFDTLIEALAALKSGGARFQARLVGDGPLRSGLEERANALGLCDSVRFLGALPADRALEEIAKADLACLACKVDANGDRDGVPVFLMEAMALGRPVVSTRVSGIPELVEEGCGLLCEPDSPEALAAALNLALSTPSLAESMAVRGRAQVERFFSVTSQGQGLWRLLSAHAGPGAVT